MIIEALAIGALGPLAYSANKSLKLDEKALNKYAKAFEKSAEAELLIKKKAEFTDKRILNVAKKKRAIIKVTMPKFIEVYSKIQKIEIENNKNINEMIECTNIDKIGTLNNLSLSIKKDFSDKELVCGIIFKGFCNMIVKDSERYVSAANIQMKNANVQYSQAESISLIYDAIIARADRIANLLVAMNALFIRSINETSKTIEKNGLNVRNYSEYDKGVLMTCVNFALAISDIINIPVVDENGKLHDSAKNMIITGENYLSKMDKIIRS